MEFISEEIQTFEAITDTTVNDLKQFNSTDEIDPAIMTKTDMLAAERENLRRRQARRVSEKLEDMIRKDTDEEGDTVMSNNELGSDPSSHYSSGSDDNSLEFSSDDLSYVPSPPAPCA